MKNKLLILFSLTFILTACNPSESSISSSQSVTSESSTSSEILTSSEEDKTSEPSTSESNSTLSSSSSSESESSSSSSSSSEVIEKYTVTWINYDGAVLEVDNDVLKDTMPTYDGDLPKKVKDNENTYIFNGWNPKVGPVVCDITYTATFKAQPIKDNKEGVDPVLSEDGKTVKYGFYPQSNVKDETLISNLNNLSETNSNGYYEYQGEQYVKEVAKTYNNESYAFANNVNIVNGTTYWFKVETITWKVLSNDNGTYYLLSDVLLDEVSYYSSLENRIVDNVTVFANDYEHSDINAYLKTEFFTKAFVNNTYIENANNGVFLPTVEDYLNPKYGFSSDKSCLDDAKKAKVSDYALCNGAWMNSKDSGSIGCGTYWTSTANLDTSYSAYNINSGGFISNYAVDGNGHCIRPAIKIKF